MRLCLNNVGSKEEGKGRKAMAMMIKVVGNKEEGGSKGHGVGFKGGI